ncbi:serine-protein kinase ATM-like [Tubulanus polymorphus]|uniref:serine-protein kinase ATM-like n=1 Tax=Tubulanus polymorphus TaxID=672921 RepID=UPI003DA64384
MSADLSEVLTCLKGTESDKSTQRDKNIKRLEILLEKKCIQESLDRNSKRGRDDRTSITWETVFKGIRNAVNREIEIIQKSKTSENTKEKKIAVMGSLMKLTIRTADARGPNLNGQDVVQHIITILNGGSISALLGNVYNNLLFQNILNVNRYITDLKPTTWMSLFQTYWSMLLKPTELNRGHIAQIISMIIQQAQTQISLPSQELFKNFKRVFEDITFREEKSVFLIENLLNALKRFCLSVGHSQRIQLCHLGEAVHHTTLYIWSMRPTESMKELLTEFWCIQMAAHHPCGAVTEEDGSYCGDTKLWKSHLYKLYDALYTDLKKTKFTGQKVTVLKAAHIELIANVCHQLFTDESGVLEVTQLFQSEEFPVPGAKKRRLETGWEVLLTLLDKHAQRIHIIPWVQIWIQICQKYPADLPTDVIEKLLSILHSLLNQGKRANLTEWYLKFAEVVANKWPDMQHDTLPEKKVQEMWMRLSDVLLRLISVQHAPDNCFIVLNSIIKHKLISAAKTEFWMTFKHSTNLTHQSLEYINSLIHKFSIITSCQTPGSSERYSIRHKLLEYLIPLLNFDEDEDDFEENEMISVPVFHTDSIPLRLLANTVISLLLRDSSNLQQVSECDQSNASDSSSLQEIATMEILFQKCSFATTSVERNRELTTNETKSSNTVAMRQRCINLLERKLEERVLKNARLILNEKFKKNPQTLVEVLKHTEFLFHLISCFLKNGIFTIQEISQSGYFDVLKALMKCFCSELLALLNQKQDAQINSLLMSQILSLFEIPFKSQLKEPEKDFLSKILATFTDKQIMQCFCSQVIKVASNHEKTPVQYDRFDLKARGGHDVEPDDFLSDSSSPTAGLNSQKFSENARFGLYDVRRLNSVEKECIEKCQLVVMWSSLVGGKIFTNAASDVIDKLFDLLDTERFDCINPFHLQLFSCIANSLLECCPVLTGDDLGIILETMRLILKKNRHNVSVCCESMQLLLLVIPQLNKPRDDEDKNALKAAQDLAIFLVNLLRDIHKTTNCCESLKILIQRCTAMLLQLDPEGEWTCRTSHASDASIPLWKKTVEALPENYHQVCVFVASEVIPMLFTKTGKGSCVHSSIHHPRNRQELIFRTVQQSIQEILSKEESDAVKEDEILNSKVTVLLTLASIIKNSIICRNKALFHLLKIIHCNGFDAILVKKVLLKIAKELDYNDQEQFLKQHLASILQQWLDAKYNITQIPWVLFNQNSEVEFYMAYKHVVVPALVMKEDMEAIKHIAHCLNTTDNELLIEWLPKIVVHILPWFAVNQFKLDYKTDWGSVESASTAYSAVQSIVGLKAIENSIANHIDEIVVDVLMTLQPNVDDTDVPINVQIILPEPNPPQFSAEIVRATMEFLTQGHQARVNSLVHLLAKSQDGIENVLLSLHIHIVKCAHISEKYRILLMYGLFMSLLLNETVSNLSGSWCFIMRDVIFTLISIITDTHRKDLKCIFATAVLDKACDLLRAVCEAGVKNSSEDFGEIMPSVVNCLMPLVQKKSVVYQKSLDLLKFLVIENETILSEPVAVLYPFHDCKEFDELRRIHREHQHPMASSLEQLAHNILMSKCYHDDLADGLDHCLVLLYKELAGDKQNITRLTNRCSTGGSNDLIELVSVLVHLTNSKSESIRLNAVQCLGEIGPVNLTATSFNISTRVANPHLDVALKVYADNYELKRNIEIFHTLNDYLIHSCIETVTASSRVLKELLAIPHINNQFVSEYESHLSDHLFMFLHPFRANKKKMTKQKNTVGKNLKSNGLQSISKETLWMPSFSSHEEWIMNLVCALIDSGLIKDEVLQLLKPVCQVQVSFCQMLLPYLIHDLLLQDIDEYKDVLSQCMNSFFSKHCGFVEQACSRATTPCVDTGLDEKSICKNQKSVEILLNVVQYLRMQDIPKRGRQATSVWQNNFWLDLDYLLIAKAAKTCGKHFSTVLYAEIWCTVQRYLSSWTQNLSENSQASSSNSQTSELSSLCEDYQTELQSLLVEAYRSIGDPDGVYCFCSGRLVNSFSRIQTYEQENQWHKAVTAYDMEMDTPRMSVQVGLLHALQTFGTGHILNTYLEGLYRQGLSETQEIQEFQYEIAWKTANWDLPSPTRLEVDCPYNQAVYSSFCGLRDKDEILHTTALQIARSQIVSELSSCSTESVRNISHVLSKLQCLNHIEDISNVVFRREIFSKVQNKWNDQMSYLQDDFELHDSVMLCQSSLLSLLHDVRKDHTVYEALTSHLLRQVRIARKSGHHQVAAQALHQLKQLEQPEISWEVKIEEAKVYWSQGEQNVAKSLLHSALNLLKQAVVSDSSLANTHADALVIYGNWLAESHSESPNTVMEKYLEKAVSILSADGQLSDRAMNAFLSLGRYADVQYQNIVNYMKSSTYEAKRAMIEESKAHLKKLSDMKDQSRYAKILQKQSVLDAQEMKSLLVDKEKFLIRAVQNYLRCLQHGDKNDLRVFRLVSLWFDNPSQNDVTTAMKTAADTIQSHKFLPLMYQLAARMSQNMDDCQTILQKIIKQTAISHPHHTLYVIIALAHAKKDAEFLKESAPSEKEDRVLAAQKMVTELRQSRCAHILSDIEKLCLAYIELANINVKKYSKQKSPINLPANILLRQLKELTNVAVPTKELAIDPTCQYENIVYVTGFHTQFNLAGGINLPKIITCIGSDGKNCKQLVKGKDDLRQDAVMQQVFGMVNTLLHKEPETRKRNLLIRTYKVIPMSQRCGILEWCEGTIPMGNYLIGNSGAHIRYEPKDWTSDKCRNTMTAAHSVKGFDGILEAYLEVCKHFKPVFRHFFLEKFPDPAHWYEKRLAYTRSVATNSIVGYILGLGDRHMQNILVDCNTAELVHIDLGVAFEQGKILPTPETVPFRLTRDIVDGMGVAGPEGVFRRCCEKTMLVMHQNKEALLTIVEVLLYDPIYTWTISPHKAVQLQCQKEQVDDTTLNTTRDLLDVDQDVNKMSERVLLRLQQKLQGIEEGIQLSIEGQVNLLIQESMDVKNLCRLFPGWQAYL